MMEPRPFDILGPLPAAASVTVLEASAGTGKTFTLAGLVTRYIAEGVATLDQMLLITFSRAATQELRDRVRRQIADAVRAFGDPAAAGDNQVLIRLLEGSPEELQRRRERLGDALAGFDAATIATTHQFCNLVLHSSGSPVTPTPGWNWSKASTTWSPRSSTTSTWPGSDEIATNRS